MEPLHLFIILVMMDIMANEDILNIRECAVT